MEVGRLREWLDASTTSFERGEVHEENLRILLGREFSPADAWSQSLAAFEWLVENATRLPARVVIRAVVPLTEQAQLVPKPIDPEAIAAEMAASTPPMLVVMPPDLAVDHRRFEEYRVALPLNVKGAAVTYSVARSLDWPTDGVWSRCVMLEHF